MSGRGIMGNNLWDDKTREKLMHIMPQVTYHASAQIRGSSRALERLAAALLEAARAGQCGATDVEMMAADGEGYYVSIAVMSDQQMDSGPLPYAQLGNIGDFDICWDCPKKPPAKAD